MVITFVSILFIDWRDLNQKLRKLQAQALPTVPEAWYWYIQLNVIELKFT